MQLQKRIRGISGKPLRWTLDFHQYDSEMEIILKKVFNRLDFGNMQPKKAPNQHLRLQKGNSCS